MIMPLTMATTMIRTLLAAAPNRGDRMHREGEESEHVVAAKRHLGGVGNQERGNQERGNQERRVIRKRVNAGG